MDSAQILLLGVILVGIILIVVSLVLFRGEGKGNAYGYFEAGNTIKAIEASIDEMDKTMNEFDNLANGVFDGLDNKYQELLFLYTLIDEKKNELVNLYGSMQSNVAVKPVMQNDFTVDSNLVLNTPKYKKIDELVAQGMPVSDIAKKLNMGQGEVKLILELGRVR